MADNLEQIGASVVRQATSDYRIIFSPEVEQQLQLMIERAAMEMVIRGDSSNQAKILEARTNLEKFIKQMANISPGTMPIDMKQFQLVQAQFCPVYPFS